MIDFGLYKGREQTGVKHLFLSEYLQRFGPIIGSWCSTITYVDCFSGPWQQKSEELKDTSFSIALQELQRARALQLAKTGRALKLRAFFVEKDAAAYSRLREFAERASREVSVEIETRHDALENRIGDIVKFVRAGQSKNFPFMFIDPTGWTGFGLTAIEPLLKLDPGEVLVNFMTGHIRRLVEHPEEGQQEGFESLYGRARCARVLERVRGTSGLVRENVLVSEYMGAIRETGKFAYVSAAVVLNPGLDRTHFHLIYATRHLKGLEVFKRAESKAMKAMQQARSDVGDRRQDNTQGAFDFRREIPKQDAYYQELRGHYVERAKERVLALIKESRGVSYDTVYARALAIPLTFESDLKGWIKEWVAKREVEVKGLVGREKSPKIEEGHSLVWIGSSGV